MNQRAVLKYKSGISIVETVVALMILGTIGAALLALNVQIQSAANTSRFKSVAEAHAQKMIEQARNKKNQDGGISGFVANCYVDGKLSTTSSNCTCTSTGVGGTAIDSLGQNYRGYVIVSNGPNNGKKVSSVVGWREKNKYTCLKVDTYFYDY